MEQTVLIPASGHNNKNLHTQSVTKQKLPLYQADKMSTYRIDSVEKEINENLISKTDCLNDKILSSPRMELSNSHTVLLDGVETGVLMSDFDQKLR